MALKIRSSKLIHGIQIKHSNEELRISQLADDTTLFLKGANDVQNALNIVTLFGKHSGLKLNSNKTEAMWIGKLALNHNKPGNIAWRSSPIKALGAYFGTNVDECNELNWNNKLKQCNSIIENWNKHKLTFYGKIQVINSIIIPKFVFLFQSLLVPKKQIVEINKLIFKFLWNNKREKIKRSVITGPKSKGGLGMIDLDAFITSLKLKWIKSLIEKQNDKAHWQIIPKYFLNRYGNNYLIFHMNLDSIRSIDTSHISDYYKNLLEIWIKAKNNDEINLKTFDDIRKQLIWGNKFIKHNRKCIIFKNWVNSNILFINDIINKNGYVCEETICNKLNLKINWIAETHTLKQCIPKAWLNILTSERSIKTKVKTKLETTIFNTQFNSIKNKEVYQIIVNKKFDEPYIHKYWNELLHHKANWSTIYEFINNIYDNRIKQFK